MIYSRTKQKGFSLVETLVYAAGTALLIGLIVSALFYTYVWYGRSAVTARIDQIGETTANRITNEMRSAISFDSAQTTFNVSNGNLKISSKVSTTTTVTKTISISNGRLTYKENAGASTFLTPSDITISRFELTKATTTVSTGIRFMIDITYSTKEGQASSTYSGYAIFRNSYQ